MKLGFLAITRMEYRRSWSHALIVTPQQDFRSLLARLDAAAALTLSDHTGPEHACRELQLVSPTRIPALARRPAEPPAPKQVQVQMKHRLAGPGAVIEYRAISALQVAFFRDLRRYQMQF